jgi:hypothetical protein
MLETNPFLKYQTMDTPAKIEITILMLRLSMALTQQVHQCDKF